MKLIVNTTCFWQLSGQVGLVSFCIGSELQLQLLGAHLSFLLHSQIIALKRKGNTLMSFAQLLLILGHYSHVSWSVSIHRANYQNGHLFSGDWSKAKHMVRKWIIKIRDQGYRGKWVAFLYHGSTVSTWTEEGISTGWSFHVTVIQKLGKLHKPRLGGYTSAKGIEYLLVEETAVPGSSWILCIG